MALVDIIKKIEADSESEAGALIAQAQQEADAIREESKKQLTALESEAEKTRTRRAGRVREHLLAKARHEAQFMHSSFKNDRIEGVFDSVKSKLLAMPEADYAHLVESSLKGMPKSATFQVAAEREKETKKILEKNGVSGASIETAPEGTLLGGFRALTKTEEYDASFTGLLKDLREQHKPRVAQELFS